MPVRWTATATPRDYGDLAPVVIDHAGRGDGAAIDLVRHAAGHIDSLVGRLSRVGARRIALVGGLAASIEAYLPAATRQRLVTPARRCSGPARLHLARARAAPRDAAP